jgi:PAS domain S-box-containing protein
MTTNKLKTKITLIIIIIISVTIGASTWHSSMLFVREYKKVFKNEVFVIGESLKLKIDRLLALGIDIKDVTDFDIQCQKVTEKYSYIDYALVVDSTGIILFKNDPFQQYTHINDPLIINAINLGQNRVTSFFVARKKYYAFSIPLENNGGQPLGALLLGIPKKVITEKTSKLVIYSILFSFISIIISLFLITVVLTTWVTKPLLQLDQAVREIRLKGTEAFSKIKIKNRDEIGRLAYSFNRMAKDLKETTVSKKYMDSIINSMTDVLIVLDPQMKIKTINQAVQEMLEYEADEILGKSVDLLFLKQKESFFQGKPLLSLFESGVLTNYETTFKRKDGGRTPVLLSCSILKDSNGEIEHLVCTAKDITERKEAEQVLKKQTEKLAHSNMELREFTYIASHDLQEPLRKIIVFSDRLQEKFSHQLSEQGIDYLNRIHNATRRMSSLINSLLTYSRVTIKAQPFSIVNLNKITTDVLSNLEIRIEQSGGYVEIRELATIEAEPTQMHQLFQNLISNALKFHREGIAPEVKVYSRIIKENTSCLWTDVKKEYVEITFEDNGIGIDPKYHERIFGVFQRLHGKDKYEGTGIGLAICQKIVIRHNGRIKVESQVGSGTKFIVKLPVRQNKLEVSESD